MTVESAEARGWGTGWPHCHPELCGTITAPGGVRVTVRREVGALAAWLLATTVQRGYPIRPGDTGGFNCRQIRSTGIPSNHSWGLAIDINWQTNPATNDGRDHTDMPSWMPDLWEGHMWRWGGHYSGGGFRDTMHYEFMGTPADAARITAGLHSGSYDGNPTAGSLTWVQIDPGDNDSMAKFKGAMEVREVQLRLAKQNLYHGAIDGAYGPQSEAAMVAFKNQQIALQTMLHKTDPRVVIWSKADASCGTAAIGALRFWTS